MYDEYLEEMRELQGQLKDREATLKQEESFVRQLDADNEELQTLKKLETQEASSSKDGHRERAVVKRAEGGPQANSTRVDKRVTGLFPSSSSSNLIPNSSLMPGSILFPSFGDPMIDVHLSQMQGVVGHVPQSVTTTGGSGDGGGNNGTTPPLDYGGVSPNGNRQGAGRQLSLTVAEEDLRMIHPMMRTRMTTTKRMKRTRKKKRKKMTIGHGGGAEDRGMIEKSRAKDRGFRSKKPRGCLFLLGQRSINSITGRCNC